jgi:hypothetical protein
MAALLGASIRNVWPAEMPTGTVTTSLCVDGTSMSIVG